MLSLEGVQRLKTRVVEMLLVACKNRQAVAIGNSGNLFVHWAVWPQAHKPSPKLGALQIETKDLLSIFPGKRVDPPIKPISLQRVTSSANAHRTRAQFTDDLDG